jgi:hypothetical protein
MSHLDWVCHRKHDCLSQKSNWVREGIADKQAVSNMVAAPFQPYPGSASILGSSNEDAAGFL